MNEAFLNKELFDAVETLEDYKYSGSIFTKKYIKQFFVLLATNLTTTVLITVDGFVVGHFVGADALNSVNLLSPFLLIVGAITALLAMGVNIALSKFYGIGSQEKKQKLFRAIVLMALMFFVVITAVQIPISYMMIKLYPVGNEIKNMMSLYAMGIMIANSVSVVSTVCTYIFIASGQVKDLLKLAILESTLNLILDFLFVGVFKLGVFGAGLGTAISCTARCVVSVLLVQKKIKIFPIKQIECREEMKDILSNGVPSMTTQLLISLMGYVMNLTISARGNMEAVTVISVCAIGGTLSRMISNSFMQAGNSIIGILVGSDDWEVAKNLEGKILRITISAVSAFVLLLFIFPQLLFGFYGIYEYTSFQIISVRLYILSFISFAAVSNLSNMCVYCGKKKATVITSILEAALLVPVFLILEKVNRNMVFLCYFLCRLVSILILSVILIKTLGKKIFQAKKIVGVHFCFSGREANEVSEKLHKCFQENNASEKDAYICAIVCEELGSYAEKNGNADELHIFLSVKFFDGYLKMFYLDDSAPAILNKKLVATNLILGNYNLLESLASEFTYQNVSGFNNFIMKFNR